MLDGGFSVGLNRTGHLTHSNVQKLAINCVCVSQNLRLTLTFLTNLALKYVQAMLPIAHVTNQVL